MYYKITLCGNKECELSTQCLLGATKPPEGMLASYAMFEGGKDCKHYMPLYEPRTTTAN